MYYKIIATIALPCTDVL